jgi:hypothetical protein
MMASVPIHALLYYMTSLYAECMNSLHEVGVTRERLQGSRLIGLEEVAEVILLGIEIGELLPGHVVLQGTPDPLNGVQFRTIGGQEHQAHVRREMEPLGRMGPAVVQHEDIQTVREGLRKGVDEELEHLGVQVRQLQKEPVTRGGLHGAIDVEPLEKVLDRAYRLYPLGREAPPADGEEAEAAFVLTENPYRTSVRGWDGLLEVFSTGSLERGKGLRIFLCDWGAAL